MKKEKNKSNFIIVIISLLILVVSLSTFLISFFNRPVYVKELQILFEIGQDTGVNLDRTDLIDFGRVSPKSASIGRIVELTNNQEFPVSVSVIFNKEIQDFFSAPQKEVINPGESKNISIWLSVPADVEFKNYSGTVKFVLRAHKG